MNSFETNPFAVLTFIVAPAILTNASSIMALSTSNRYNHAFDRLRNLSELVEHGGTTTRSRNRRPSARVEAGGRQGVASGQGFDNALSLSRLGKQGLPGMPLFTNFLVARPWALVFVALSVAGIWGAFRFPRRGQELAAFLSSCVFLLGMVATALAGNYPFWLRSTLDPSYSLTAANTASARYGMGVALAWWAVGIALTAGYLTYLFRSMRGKVGADPGAGY